jgi:hypothetical protein
LNLIKDMVGRLFGDRNLNDDPLGNELMGHLNEGSSCNFGILYWKDKMIDFLYLGLLLLRSSLEKNLLLPRDNTKTIHSQDSFISLDAMSIMAREESGGREFDKDFIGF